MLAIFPTCRHRHARQKNYQHATKVVNKSDLAKKRAQKYHILALK